MKAQDELAQSLVKLSKAITDLTEIAQAQQKVNEGKFKTVDQALIQKRIEDGVIAKFETASPHQLDQLFKNRFFRFYEPDLIHKFQIVSSND